MRLEGIAHLVMLVVLRIVVRGIRIVRVDAGDVQRLLDLPRFLSHETLLWRFHARPVVREAQIVERIAHDAIAVIDLVRGLAEADEHLAAVDLALERCDLRRTVARGQRVARAIDERIVIAR